MANYNATIVRKATYGERGREFTTICKYDLAGGGLANTDTITFPSGFVPPVACRLIGFSADMPEVDTNATPTGKAIIGILGGDTDALVVEFGLALGLQNSLPTRLLVSGNGVKIGDAFAGTESLGLTVTAAVATSASAGDLFFTARWTID